MNNQIPFIRLITFILILFALNSCLYTPSIQGSKEMINFEMKIEDFNEIDISKVINVEIIQSDLTKLEIRCNKNIQKYLNINSDKNKLNLTLKKVNLSNVFINMIIRTPRLNKIELNGVSKLYINDFLTDNLKIDLSGASSVEGACNSKDLMVRSSGSSKFKWEGSSINTTIELSGASNFNGANFITKENLSYKSSGASQGTLISNGNCKIDLSGASMLYLNGKPTIKKQKTSGASQIIINN